MDIGPSSDVGVLNLDENERIYNKCGDSAIPFYECFLFPSMDLEWNSLNIWWLLHCSFALQVGCL